MRQKILIVDDETELRETLEEILRAQLDGVEILHAKNADEALELVKDETPDLILSDLRMPGLDGLGLLERLRADGCFTPVVVITGYGDKHLLRRAWLLGAFDFLDKPIDAETLLPICKNALEAGYQYNRDMQKPVSGQAYSSVNVFFARADFAALRRAAEAQGLSVATLVHNAALEIAAKKAPKKVA